MVRNIFVGFLCFLLMISNQGCYRTQGKDYINSYKEEFLTFNGDTVYWDHDAFPLLVTYSSNEPIELKEALRYSTDLWNEKVGKKIFSLMELKPDNKILFDEIPGYRIIKVGFGKLSKQNNIENLGETTSLYFGIRSGRKYSCFIRLNREMTADHYNGIMVHELGHVLGLKHDSDYNSIMYETFSIKKKWYIEEIDIILIKDMIRYYH
jgi:hypothetical protein